MVRTEWINTETGFDLPNLRDLKDYSQFLKQQVEKTKQLREMNLKQEFETAKSGVVVITDGGIEHEYTLGKYGEPVVCLSEKLGFTSTNEGLLVYAIGTGIILAKVIKWENVRVVWISNVEQ